MKYILLNIFLIMINHVYAQKEHGINNYKIPSDTTAFGKPNGNNVSKEIGVAGGSVISDDGRIELIFPEGALATNTTISIQPITNLSPNGNGKAYNFEPSGTQFQKPVKLIYHYSDEEADECPPDMMGIGTQDHSGVWSFFDFDDWDSAGRKLTGNIEHFSTYTPVSKLKLAPLYKKLRVGDTLLLWIVDIRNKFPAGVYPSLSAVWFVNDVMNGTPRYGSTSSQNTLGSTKIHMLFAEYYAPKKLPEKTPIWITAKVLVSKKEKGKESYDVVKKWSCKIELYDEYKIIITDTTEARARMGVFVADSGTFMAKVTPEKVDVTDVMNYPPYMFIKHNPPKPFKIDVYTGEPCKGTVNIGEMRNNGMLLSYSQSIHQVSDKPLMVLLKFSTNEVLTFRYLVKAKGISSGVEALKLQANPGLINFEVSGEEQVHHVATREYERYTVRVIPWGKPKYVRPTD